ncbi:MAG: VPLPA-CTERM sorting domain-containing protein [Pseudooceanicola sp.]|nr:VPLPA-CTERM sorting domain-containing protein [Pseudooceanicola sp.]
MKKILASLAAAIAVSATSVSAADISVTQQDPLFGSANLRKTVSISYQGTSSNVYAGLFHLTGDLTGNGVSNFVAFCVDLAETLGNPQTMNVWNDPFDATVRGNIDKLFTNVLGGQTMQAGITDQITAAGMQLALWEIVYDSNDLNLASGTFHRDGGNSEMAWARAGQYLADLALGTPSTQTVSYLYSDGNQDLVTSEPTPSPVPLPASGLLVLAGFGGFAALKRRKAK